MIYRIISILIIIVTITSTSLPQRTQAQTMVTAYFMAMLAQVSDEITVILVKKRPDFISYKTPLIVCIVGAGAGVIATTLPNLFTVVTLGVWYPINWVETGLFAAYGCTIAGVGGIGGTLTEWALVSLGD